MPHFLRITLLSAPLLATLLLVSAAARAGDKASFELGKQIFTTVAEPQCGVCHTLADAETTGEIGPNLDDLKPSADQVRLAVEGGIGIMPAFDTLTDEQIDAVALYVSEVAGKTN